MPALPQAHPVAGSEEHSTVRAVWKGIRRMKPGSRQAPGWLLAAGTAHPGPQAEPVSIP